MSKSSLNLRPIFQVFKTGNTIFVDIPKVEFNASKKETKVFWNSFYINSTHNSSKTSILVDDHNFVINGKFTCRIVFHDESLNSLTMHPGKLSRSPLLGVFLIHLGKYGEKGLKIRKKVIKFSCLFYTGF